MNRESFIRVYDTTFSVEGVDVYGIKVRLEGTDYEATSRAATRAGIVDPVINSDEFIVEDSRFDATIEDLINLLEHGSKINAIKRWRELTGWGLRDSKDLIDRIIGVGAKIATNRIASGS